jgi:hypothetical protein
MSDKTCSVVKIANVRNCEFVLGCINKSVRDGTQVKTENIE